MGNVPGAVVAVILAGLPLRVLHGLAGSKAFSNVFMALIQHGWCRGNRIDAPLSAFPGYSAYCAYAILHPAIAARCVAAVCCPPQHENSARRGWLRTWIPAL